MDDVTDTLAPGQVYAVLVRDQTGLDALRLSFTDARGIASDLVTSHTATNEAGAVFLLPTEPCETADLVAPFGVLDSADVLEAVSLIETDDPRADLNQDGRVELFDLVTLLRLYDAGCE